jgi:hypothetical protein
MRNLFQTVNVRRCVCRVRAVLFAESEPGMVDHSGSQGHGRMSYPAGFFRVTPSASLIHCFQITGVLDQADMSCILIFRPGVASVALDAGNCMASVHTRIRFVACDAIASVLAESCFRYLGRTAPPCGVECLGCVRTSVGKGH